MKREQRIYDVSKIDSYGLNQIEGWLKSATFDTYSVQDENRVALEAALSFANRPVGLLTLWGENGPGKTHLLAAIYHKIVHRGIPVLYTTLPDLTSKLRCSVGDGKSEDFYQFISQFRVLLIDEVDKADLRNWTREQSFRLFNRRYNNFESAGTAMAMNKNPNVYENEFGYLFSRMMDDRSQCIYIGGGDNRKKASLLQKVMRLRRRNGKP